jgi:hypothetical protein
MRIAAFSNNFWWFSESHCSFEHNEEMTMNKHDTSRRQFLRHALACTSMAALCLVSKKELAHAQATQPLSEEDPVAKALGYYHDASKVDPVKWPKRAGAEGAKQLCSNCTFFSQGGMKVEGKEGEFGRCTIFAQGLVNSKGWCNSWILKPA